MWYLQCFFSLFFFQNVFYSSPCVLHNRWNENMAVKRDVQYIMTCDRSLKKRIWFKNKNQKREHRLQLKWYSWSPTNVCSLCFCLGLKATVSLEWDNSTISTLQRPDSSYFTFHHAKFHSHWCSNATSTEHVLFLAQWMTQNNKKKKQTNKSPYIQLYRSTSTSENYITQICTGPRITMHSSPMTELSISS